MVSLISEPSALRAQTALVAEFPDLRRLAAVRGALPFFYLEHPEGDLAIAAFGIAAELRASGPARFQDLSLRGRRMLSSVRVNSYDSGAVLGPLMVGGFGFSDRQCTAHEWREFPAACLMLPRMLWIRRQGQCTLTRTWEEGREDPPETALPPAWSTDAAGSRALEHSAASAEQSHLSDQQARWRERVQRVRAMVADGAVRKVVLSRRIETDCAQVNPVSFLSDSRQMRPLCFNFWFSRGTTGFFGSTPELLVRVEGERVFSAALAGTASRGATAQSDEALGDSLLACAKNREEHRYVSEAVKSALGTVADDLRWPAKPGLMRLPEAHHLFTPFEGRLRHRFSAIELAGLLHPTPAVCGEPREAARQLIEQEEPDRGWYSGALGWMDGDGNGEFAVALRCALTDGARMFLWAGAGILADSDPQAEFAETEAKFAALLGGSEIGHAE